MNAKLFIEIFGYIGSGLVVVSMLMSSVVRLRVINTIGSVIFMIYALIIRSYPTALMNLCLVTINIYQLMRLRNTDKHYAMFESSMEDGSLSYLLQYYKDDIAKFFPSFSIENMKKKAAQKVFTVCCDNEIAGFLIGTLNQQELEIALDYSTPVYRDCSVGEYLYSQLSGMGIKSLVYRGTTPEHVSYVEKVGFTKSEDGVYTKQLG